MYGGASGNALQGVEAAVHVRVAAVDDAAHAISAGGPRLGNHQVDVVGKVRRRRRSLPGGNRVGQWIVKRQVLVKQHCSRRQLRRRHVLEQSADDGASGKGWRERAGASLPQRAPQSHPDPGSDACGSDPERRPLQKGAPAELDCAPGLIRPRLCGTHCFLPSL